MDHEHTADAIRQRLAAGPDAPTHVRDWVYGGIDGAVTTFAIVSGVVGAQLSPAVIVILGVANLVADGFSMAAGNYLATRTEHEELRYVEAIERQHIAAWPEGEREEVREIFRQHGIEGELLEQVTAVITADRDRWVHTMLRHEYGLPAKIRSPTRAAAATFLAFIVFGAVPLVPFLAGVPHAFWVASGATGVVFAGIGALKSRWSPRPWWRASLETLAVGGCAAAVAYALGAWLRGLVA